MTKTRKPTVISAFLLSGTVALAGGAAVLAAHPVADMMSDNDRAVAEAPAAAGLIADVDADPPPGLAGLAESSGAGVVSPTGSADGLDRGARGDRGHGRNRSSKTTTPIATDADTSAELPQTSKPRKGDVRGNGSVSARKAAPGAAKARRVATPTQVRATPITYVVEQGDTLGGIARWFAQRGYGDLYRANQAVIGNDPNRIFPGQRITISNGTMTMSAAR